MTILEEAAQGAAGPREPARRSRWGRHIDVWEPEDKSFWSARGARTARKNLLVSMFSEHLAFSVWVLWTVVVLYLADAGLDLSVSQLFLLTLIPNLVGSLLRIPYTFAVLRLGGRAWTTLSTALLLLPVLLIGAVVPSHWLAHQHHATQFWILALCAATSGVGGGNFASSMANISFFYPESKKGSALGWNAAGGNLGVATAQLAVPLVLAAGLSASALRASHHPVHLGYAGLMWVPLIVVAAAAAWLLMDTVPRGGEMTSYKEVLGYKHTWIISLLYVGTFGSFIGFSFALPLVIKTSFPTFLAAHPVVATYLGGLGFLGAALGSLSRPVGGWLADRLGGPSVTFASFLGMALFGVLATVALEHRSFAGFISCFSAVFVLAGAGNGSTYKTIPAVFASLARRGSNSEERIELKRRAAAVIGIAGAAGALGGVAVQAAIRQASLHASALVAAAKTPAERAAVAAAHSTWIAPALVTFVASYLLLAVLTWYVYLRRSDPLATTALEGAGGAS